MAQILEILTSEESEHTLLPELLARQTRLEKKVEYLQILASPDKPVMDMQTVCKVLKLRPKAVSELANSGVLPSREQGSKTVFYEEGVIKYFTTQPAWKEAVVTAKPATVQPEAAEVDTPAESRQRVDINVASKILGRSLGAVYQLTSNNKVPFYKEGSKVYFYTDELREWAKNNPPRPRKKK